MKFLGNFMNILRIESQMTMKKIILLVLLFSSSYISEIVAQNSIGHFSAGLGVSRSRYFGKREMYPIGAPEYFPRMHGARLLFMYGKNKFRINFGYTYYPTQAVEYKKYYPHGPYYDITSDFSMMEWDCDFVYYPFRFSTYEFGGVYVLAGGTIRHHVFDSTIPNPYVSEAKLFEDERVIGTHLNVGLGLESALPRTSFLVFMEGRLGIHTNSYVNPSEEVNGYLAYRDAVGKGTVGDKTLNDYLSAYDNKSYTTIKETQLVNFWAISIGVRYIFPREGEPPHSRYRGRGRIKTTNRGRTHSKRRR